VATGAPSPKCVAASLPACSNVNTGFPGIFGNAPSGEVSSVVRSAAKQPAAAYCILVYYLIVEILAVLQSMKK
jgi:hypothetical protein